MRICQKFCGVLLVLLCLSSLLSFVAMAQSSNTGPVVRAVLFYSPACPHCHSVINEVLVPMTQEYGDTLQVLGIDTSQPQGSEFYQAAIEHFEIPPERRGVPTLIIGDMVLVGSGEIPAKFPQLVDQHLADNGIDWPAVPGLVEAIEAEKAAAETEAEAQPTEAETGGETEAETAPPPAEATDTAVPTPSSTAAPPATNTPVAAAVEAPVQTINTENVPETGETALVPPPDPVGVGLAALVLIALIAALILAVWRLVAVKPALFQFERGPLTRIAGWAIPVISLVGLGVSLYLAYVEINQVKAVCGPVGHCNIVQSSQYAQLLGVPIAVLGILNYVALIGLWAVQKYSAGPLAALSLLGLAVLTLWSVLFSIYLTVLEIFVINAVCMWCLTSAVISMALMLLVIIPITPTSSSLLQMEALPQ